MKKKTQQIKLAKFLAEAGVASRRKAEDLIRAGKVKVKDQVITDVATRVNPQAKDVKVANKLVSVESKVYYLLNKPKGYVCSVKDPHNSKTILSLVPKRPKVFPVGRLDKNSQGLILLTNDGDLAYHLTHPKFEVTKTYVVKTDKSLDKHVVIKLKRGIKLEEGLAKADRVKLIGLRKLEIVIHQGWKRQIRRMLDELGYKVISLTRMSEGKLKMGYLPQGKYKELRKQDIV